MTESQIANYIKSTTIPISDIDGNSISIFKWLSSEIYEGKSQLKSNSIQFIILKILTKQKQTIDIKRRDHFDVYVVGNFRKIFSPVLQIAETFATLYSEIGVLPNIVPVPIYLIKNNKEILYNLKNGVLLYERR